MGAFSFFGDLFEPKRPAEREFAGEGWQNLEAQQALMPSWAQSERQWMPYWAGTANAGMASTLFGGGMAPALNQGNRLAGSTLRKMQQWSPSQYALLGTLGSQAEEELANPYALSAAEVREITQASLANPALASMGAQPRDAYLAYANLGSAAAERAAQRRAFAQQVMQAQNQYQTAPALNARNAVLQNAMGAQVGPSLFNPWNQYASQLYSQNYGGNQANKLAGMGYGMQFFNENITPSGMSKMAGNLF